jgi:type I restriction-modification system DNA methylase subunit
MSEADVHFEFYRYVQNAIDENPRRGSITFSHARPEYGEGIPGRADIVIFDDDNEPVLVIEAKRPEGGADRDIDPYSRDVIQQAFRYAGGLGSPYFCTFNGSRLVIFNTYEEGVPLLQRSTKAYTISNLEEFADTLLDEIADINQGHADWDTLDTVFIERVNSLHEYLTPRIEESLTNHLEDDEDFRSSFVDWTGAQGFDYNNAGSAERADIRREFAIQSAYLLVNKIIFYKILENSPTYAEDVTPLEVRSSHIREDLEEAFSELVENVDFEAIYEHDEIYSEIPLDEVAEKIQAFISELDNQDLSQFDSDVIGRIYEGVIPAERRREMGEYYTPPAICELIVRLTVDEPDDVVFDPAVGSGGFMVSAYSRLRSMLAEPKGSHNRILDQLYATEINRFPAHLTAINLALQDLSSYTEEVNVEVSDFFDVKPENLRLGRQRASAEGGETDQEVVEELGGFNAIVANPPYIRQENIDNKDKVRSHLSNRNIDGEYISRRSDIYAYFITHGTQFLNEGGDLGFITSDRWLDTQYGEDVQQFILENYEVRAIIKFDRQVFDDALVDSSVIILRRQFDESERDSNVAKFIRLKEELDIEDIASLVEQETEPNKLISNEDYRLVTRKQSALHHEKKWNVFFFAPPIYFDLDAHPKVVELSEISEVNRGVTTGANKFFTGHTEEMEDLGLGPYTSYALKATGQVDTIKVTKEDAMEWSILDVHDITKDVTEDNADFGTTDEEQVKEWLDENDHDALLEYIRWGEDNNYHNRRTLSNRDVWFDLGILARPKILSTMFTWRTHRVFWNEAEAPTSDQFYYVRPHGEIDEKLLAALLNSRTVWLSNELKGRRAGGQGMTRLQTKVYETEQWTVPDPRGISDEAAQEIKEAFEDLMEKEKEFDEPELEDTKEERDKLDRKILETLELRDNFEELKEAIDAMLQMRDEGAGKLTSVLVGRKGREEAGSEVIDLPGVEEARESTTLGDFQ